MSGEQNKAIVRRYLEEVWGRGNIAALHDLVSQDVQDHDPGPGQPCGMEGQEYATRGFLNAISNYHIDVEYLLAQGDRVVDHWTYTGTHTGDMFGRAPTGRKFTITGTDEWRIAGGKIVEMWHREDMLSMMQQLGYAPAPPLPQSFGRPRTGTAGRAATGTPPPESRIRDRIRQGFQELLDRGNLSAAEDFLTPDYAGHFSAFPPVYGCDGFREFLSIYTNGLSDRRTEIEEIIVDGDLAAARVVYHGKNTGSMMGMPATGKTVATKALTIFRMAGDKVAEQWANNDDVGMMAQLGAIPEMANMPAAVPC